MFNKFISLVSNFYFTKPSVHLIKPRSINVYFKNSKDRNFTYVDLSDFSSFSLFVQKIENGSMLVLEKTFKDNSTSTVDLALFETEKEAFEALDILKVKLYSTEKSLIKFIFVLFVVLLSWGVLSDLAISSTYKTKLALTSSVIPTNNVENQQQTNEQLNALRQQLEQQKLAAQKQVPTEPIQQAQTPVVEANQGQELAPVDSFMQGLKK